MKRHITLFFTALQFYTRIPVPKWVGYQPENLSAATAYLPFIGWIVGLIAGVAWLGGLYFTDVTVGLLFSMTASILATGAFHEDGFADVCDGFGGGWTKEKILEIMKDSRLGTYGATGLVLMLAFKFSLLQILAAGDHAALVLLLVAGHSISRLMPAFVIFFQNYARETDDSKAKPVAEKPGWLTLSAACFFGIIPLVLLAFSKQEPLVLLSLVVLGIITFFLSRYFQKWIGGYTGDCLGAIQQVSETGFYLFIVALWKYI
jgi:adenosylcobinamide-GDP ribazoletransferase